MNLSLVYRQKISMTSIGRWPNIQQAVAAATKYYESTCAITETNDDQKQEDILSLSNSTLNVVTSNEDMVSSPILNFNHKHKKKRKAFLDDSEEEEDSEDNNENQMATNNNSNSNTNLGIQSLMDSMSNLTVASNTTKKRNIFLDDSDDEEIDEHSNNNNNNHNTIFLDNNSSSEDDSILYDNTASPSTTIPLPIIYDLTNTQYNSPKQIRNKKTNTTGTKKKKTQTPAQWKVKRNLIVQNSMKEFNSNIFDNQLDENMPIEWSTRLRKTAGLTYLTLKRDKHDRTITTKFARIELASKVLTDEHRLRATLLHELCHAAAWVIDGVRKPPHGPVFKKWGTLSSQMYADLPVSTCHNYKIEYKYIYRCENYGKSCHWEMGRHSKSVDTKQKCCGHCRGKIANPLIVDNQGNIKQQRKKTKYQEFQTEQFKQLANSLLSFGEKNKEISRRWKIQQDARRDAIVL